MVFGSTSLHYVGRKISILWCQSSLSSQQDSKMSVFDSFFDLSDYETGHQFFVAKGSSGQNDHRRTSRLEVVLQGLPWRSEGNSAVLLILPKMIDSNIANNVRWSTKHDMLKQGFSEKETDCKKEWWPKHFFESLPLIHRRSFIYPSVSELRLFKNPILPSWVCNTNPV